MLRKICNPVCSTKHRKKRKNDDDDSSDDEGITFDPLKLFRQIKKDDVYVDGNHIYFRTDVTMENVRILCDLIDRYAHVVLNTPTACWYKICMPLYVHITSLGGDVFGGLMGYDYIRNSQIPIYTVSEGYTISSGSIMFMAGKRRLMTKDSYMLVHQLSTCTHNARTNYAEQIDDMANSKELMSKIYGIYMNNLRHDKATQKLTLQKLEKHMMHELYWNFDTCMRYGFIDDEYKNSSLANEVDKQTIQAFVKDTDYYRVADAPDAKIYNPSQVVLKRLAELNQKTAEDNSSDEESENKVVYSKKRKTK